MKKNNKKEIKRNKIKIVFEIIIIPLCITYLIYTLFGNIKLANQIIFYSAIIITALTFIIKYFREVYIFEHKYNYLKILFIVLNIIMLIATILNIVLDMKMITVIFFILLGLLLLYLISLSIKNLIYISKSNDSIYKKVYGTFFSLTSVMTILITLIMIMS